MQLNRIFISAFTRMNLFRKNQGCERMLLVFNMIYVLTSLPCIESKTAVTLEISTSKAVNIISNKFLSVAIDSGQIRHNWEKLNFSSPKVESLAKALSPCYIRIGGTAADFLKFSLQTTKGVNITDSDDFLSSNRKSPKFENFTMRASQWDAVNSFVDKVGWSMIFDLNSLIRSDGQWSPDNALLLMKYTAMKGYKIAGWELGNEPDLYKHHIGYSVSASQRAYDYMRLHSILKQYPQWRESIIIGPSTTQLRKKEAQKYFQQFLEVGGSDIVTNPTFHHYYVNGRNTSIDQFMDPNILDDLAPQIKIGNNIARHPPHGKLWLGETGSAYGGGAHGLSDRYVAGFMWMDKLGISANLGLDVVVRQNFYGAYYSLIDSETLDPNPDFWLSYIYDTLVGQIVLNVTLDDLSGYTRLYAHCTNAKRSKYSIGSITAYGMNLNDEDTTLLFPQFPKDFQFHVYLLQPVGKSGLKSQSVALNGRILKLNSDYSLPNVLTPNIQSGNVTLPAKTFGFVVLPNSKAGACL